MPDVVVTYIFNKGTPHQYQVTCKPADGYTETVFADGTRVPARPQDTEEYRERAKSLGYGEDTAAMSREHEVMHSLLAERKGHPYSLALWAVAHALEADDPRLWSEESEVLRLQLLLNETWRVALPVAEERWLSECWRLLRRNPLGRE